MKWVLSFLFLTYTVIAQQDKSSLEKVLAHKFPEGKINRIQVNENEIYVELVYRLEIWALKLNKNLAFIEETKILVIPETLWQELNLLKAEFKIEDIRKSESGNWQLEIWSNEKRRAYEILNEQEFVKLKLE